MESLDFPMNSNNFGKILYFLNSPVMAKLGNVKQALAERCLALGPSGLSKNELTELLYLAPAMLMMHRAVWLRSVEGIHSVWTHAVDS